ncbi:MAG TPA: pseudouridine-5'-phosphate glycosidase [Gaiellaceae bacterium]|nr:pseudouridine-5'-phosphate glycosidase [Gaiellaceae bacterium]
MHLEPWGDSLIQVAPEVRDALDSGRAVVALETTLVSHGFPGAEGLDVALEAERRVRAAGAVPATVGVLDRRVQVGLDPDELERFAAAGDSARKAGPRDLAVCVATGALGATTVGGTLAVCAVAGVRFMGTGGIGGVHRGFVERPDVSADLGELARASVLVVSSGVKSLLDVTATLEVLETLGVPVLGWQVETLPLFYTAEGGPPAPATVATANEAAAIARAHWSLGRAGLVLARPPAENLEVEPLIEAALAEARAREVTGQAVTPFVLAEIHRESGGETVRINKRLIADNAALAAEVAVAYTAA